MRQNIKTARKRHFGRYLVLLVFVLLLPAFINFTRRSTWNGVRRLTIVVDTLADYKSLAIFSIEPPEGRASYFLLPNNALLDVPYGYKTYQAASVYRLGELEGGKKGGFLLAKSIESTLGIAIDNYLVAKSQSFPFLPQNMQDLKQVKLTYFTLIKGMFSLPKLLSTFKGVDTNITVIDKWRLWNAIRKLRTDQISFRNLSESQALESDQLPDGSSVMLINKELFDVATSDSFQDAKVRAENITLEIVNATGKERIASEFSRILEHMGGNVIVKTTAKSTTNETCVLYFSSPKLDFATVTSRLKNLYKCTKKDIMNEEGNLADMKIVLGEGFIK